MKKLFSLIALVILGGSIYAQDAATAVVEPLNLTNATIYLMEALVVLVLFLVLYLSFVVNQVKNEMAGLPAPTFWQTVFSLKPVSEESKMEIADHDFDGIKELSNPIPPWFNALFYGTIVFGIGYLIVYHLMGSAPLQAAEYDNEVKKTEAMKKAYLEKMGNSIDESNVTLLADASALDAGKQEFITKCKACHGENGEGGVGPNLTDNYWIHGGSISDVYKTIKYGVPAKGMIAWESSLNPIKMQQVASYIMTLNGTNPAGGKEPQGVLYQPAGSATADTTQAAN